MSYFAMCPGATQSPYFAKSSFFNYYTPYKINTKAHLVLLHTGTPYRDKYYSINTMSMAFFKYTNSVPAQRHTQKK